MLEIRPICEHCGKSLPNESLDAMICTFECTYCKECVENILENVCPNCGGGFEKRPIRPKGLLKKHPSKKEPYLKPVNFDQFDRVKDNNKNIKPHER